MNVAVDVLDEQRHGIPCPDILDHLPGTEVPVPVEILVPSDRVPVALRPGKHVDVAVRVEIRIIKL